MSRYDCRTTTFSPDGRLFQVEYAMEAIRQAGACIGLVFKDGIILVGEKKKSILLYGFLKNLKNLLKYPIILSLQLQVSIQMQIY